MALELVEAFIIRSPRARRQTCIGLVTLGDESQFTLSLLLLSAYSTTARLANSLLKPYAHMKLSSSDAALERCRGHLRGLEKK